MFRSNSMIDENRTAPSSRGKAPGADTKTRIFGMSVDEIDKVADSETKQSRKGKKASVGGKMPDREIAVTHEEKFLEENVPEIKDKSPEKPRSIASDEGLHKITHGIRYSSFMDENMSNQAKIREQQLEQKKWLDQQIAEKKLLNKKNKRNDVLYQNSLNQQAVVSSSESDQGLIKKREAQQEIQDYNVAVATRKRQNEKNLKETDKKEEAERQQKANDKDDQMQKDRFSARNMH